MTSSNSTHFPPPGKFGHVSPNDPRALWNYNPSFFAAIIFSVLFGCTLVAHVAQAFIYRKKLCWVIIMSAFWQLVAFVLRTLSAHAQLNKGYIIPMQILLLLAPLWTNAFCYMLLGRMINYFPPDRQMFRIPARRFTNIFVALDVVAFLVQGTGGSMSSETGPGSAKVVKLGIHIYMIGIGVQEGFLLFFLYIAFRFQRKLALLAPHELRERPYKPLLYSLYVALVLITIRIVYREFEFAFGVMSFLTTHEVFVYVFDSVPMFFALVLFNVVQPGRTLVGEGSEFEPKPKKEKKGKKGRGANEASTEKVQPNLLRDRSSTSLSPTSMGDANEKELVKRC